MLYGDNIMITYFEGTIFNAPAKALVNTVNIKGVMGAGIALEFSLRYPEMFKEYKKKCDNYELSIGKMDYHFEDDTVIVNFPTKRHYRYDSRLEWIEEGLQNFVATYKDYNITSVAFPKLGCLNGKLKWEDVQPLMEKYLKDIDALVYICTDSVSYAEGKEKEMVDLFNQATEEDFEQKVKLKKDKIAVLMKRQPIKRFWELSKITEISGAPYKKLFKYFYKQTGESDCVQMTLFDGM